MAGLLDLILPKKGVPSPAQLYEKAVPRVDKIMQQYDTAAPLIDWVSNNAIASVAIIWALGAGAVVGGNWLYDMLKKR